MNDKDNASAADLTVADLHDHATFARAKPLRRLPVEQPASDLIPARMINEVLYCERLMYLERVQGEWAENEYTADGRGVSPRGALSQAANPARGRRPCSVRVSRIPRVRCLR